MVIAATNNYKALDEAFGTCRRFDKNILYYPDHNTRIQLIKIYTKKKTFAQNVSIDEVVAKFEGLSCSQIETILNEAAMVAAGEGQENITENHLKESVKRICNAAPAHYSSNRHKYS